MKPADLSHACRLPLATGLAAVLCLAAALGPWAVQAQDAAPPPPAAAPAPDSAPPAAPPQAPDKDAQAAADEAKPPEQNKVIQLNGVTVQGKRNPLDDSDKHLKQLQDALPCNGCDAKPQTHKKLVNRVLNAVGERVLPTEAPDHSTRDPNDKAAEFSQQNNCTAGNVGGCVPDNAKP